MDLKPLSPENAGEMSVIEAVCFSRPWSINMCRAELEHDYSRYWGAFVNGSLAGYAGMNIIADEGYITNVAVLPEHRRGGIAKALIGKMLLYRACLFTLEVRESNAAAIRLYESFGFKTVGIRKKYYDRPDEDALIMTLEVKNEYFSG